MRACWSRPVRRIAEAQLDATDLANRIRVLATDAAQRLAMAQAARALAKPDADRVVAQHCLEVAA